MTLTAPADVWIGDGFICRGGESSIDNGAYSVISVSRGATLRIGECSGMSTTCLHCTTGVYIGSHVNIGAGCLIMDTDFHSTDWRDRADRAKDVKNRRCAPVHIGDYVFIGARSIIGKGVTIGARSIIGAGSVVTSNIPADCIAAGNPCRVIRSLA